MNEFPMRRKQLLVRAINECGQNLAILMDTVTREASRHDPDPFLISAMTYLAAAVQMMSDMKDAVDQSIKHHEGEGRISDGPNVPAASA